MALEKATIIVHEGRKKGRITVLFNPGEYSLEDSNNFALEYHIGQPLPVAQFMGGTGTTLTMDLFFDTYEDRIDVRNYTNQISGLLDRDSDLHRPPLVSFAWGSMDPFKGVVEKVTQKFTMFLDSGTPVRATLSVTFRQCQSITEQNQASPLQSSDRTKQKTLKQGDQLWMIAGEEYENPSLWREIARANGIDNPRMIEAGRHLIIPPLE
ncbi:hypothetical protein DCCM_3943 [Desulfocucumis palustris]|uniref:LysM domain-containing protein n=1 Tax=Desulfocucumis palustris TaxID=1898651 RepID=A0A2L2XGH7_9FIRM|nr:LysM peptidoglycan-binding domain-containing protein [Desulfocucumis palustris]GBF34823.1 hypothetical protein DCCM_3943 [Desulfocucumis palustris]